MRDIPIFATELGVASLTLNQIPYTKKAYIRIQDSEYAEEFISECVSFCVAAGAEYIYATGHSACEKYKEYTTILQMQADISVIGDTDAALFPVTEKTIEQWREIYNQKVRNVPNGSWMTSLQAQELLQDGYFIHRDHVLLGIGKVSDNQIHWVASCVKGAGEDIVRSLCHAITGETVTLEVASSNKKAMQLYCRLGFIAMKELSRWYQIK